MKNIQIHIENYHKYLYNVNKRGWKINGKSGAESKLNIRRILKNILILINIGLFLRVFIEISEFEIHGSYLTKWYFAIFFIDIILAGLATISLNIYYRVSNNDDIYIYFLFLISLTIELTFRFFISSCFHLDIIPLFVKSIIFRSCLFSLILFKYDKFIQKIINYIKNNKRIFINMNILFIMIDLNLMMNKFRPLSYIKYLYIIIIIYSIMAVLYNISKAKKNNDKTSIIIFISFIFISISYIYTLSANLIGDLRIHSGGTYLIEAMMLFIALALIILGVIIRFFYLVEEAKMTKENYSLFFNLVDNQNDNIFIYNKSDIIYANKIAKKRFLGDENYKNLNCLKSKINNIDNFQANEIKNDILKEINNTRLVKDKSGLVHSLDYQVINIEKNNKQEKIGVFITRDITKEIETRKEVFIENKKFDFVNNNVEELVFITDEYLKITYINRMCEKYFQKSIEDVIGTSLLEYMDIKNILEKINDQVYLKDKKKLVNAKLNVMTDDEEKTIGYVVICFDCKKDEKVNINKKDSFANLSHELRTPIHIIYSSLQLLNSQKLTESCSDFKKSFDKYEPAIRVNSLRLLKLINDIIDVNKLDNECISYNKEICNIVELVENVSNSVLPYMKTKNIEFIFDTTEEERYIECDHEKIERVFLNLLSNAVKFTPESGTIKIFINFTSDWISISVKDSGIGISEDYIGKIFDRYVQDENLKSKSKGSGIGLSLVKSFVELHDGKMELNSKLGSGSEFIVHLKNISDEENLKRMLEYSGEELFLGDISVEFSNVEVI
ncbi:MAG: ATP-binding protein [Sarcina sp.]